MSIIVKPEVELIFVTPEAEKIIEKAGRCCYKSEDKITENSASQFVEKLCHVNKHESVLEHAVATFRFVTDRGVTHELVRHRLISPSQESTRYCNYAKGKFNHQISVIQPPGLDDNPQAFCAWKNSVDAAEVAYLLMLNAGCTPQIARSVLPTCLKTEIFVTANLREWKHIFKMRCDIKAHPQIREIMLIAENILKAEVPSIFK